MLDARDVTACLVTRGDQPGQMALILRSLIFSNVVVWDNSIAPDWKVAGRYMAAAMAETPYVYFQDDDVLVPETTQLGLLIEYKEPIVANWGHGENPDGYDDLPLVCAGAIADRHACLQAMATYAVRYGLDSDFMFEADFAIGVLYPSFKHVRLPFEINLDIAQHDSRLVNQPWQKELKLDVTNRARRLRDAVR